MPEDEQRRWTDNLAPPTNGSVRWPDLIRLVEGLESRLENRLERSTREVKEEVKELRQDLNEFVESRTAQHEEDMDALRLQRESDEAASKARHDLINQKFAEQANAQLMQMSERKGMVKVFTWTLQLISKTPWPAVVALLLFLAALLGLDVSIGQDTPAPSP